MNQSSSKRWTGTRRKPLGDFNFRAMLAMDQAGPTIWIHDDFSQPLMVIWEYIGEGLSLGLVITTIIYHISLSLDTIGFSYHIEIHDRVSLQRVWIWIS